MEVKSGGKAWRGIRGDCGMTTRQRGAGNRLALPCDVSRHERLRVRVESGKSMPTHTASLAWLKGERAGHVRALNQVVAKTARQTDDNACPTGSVGQTLGIDQLNDQLKITRLCEYKYGVSGAKDPVVPPQAKEPAQSLRLRLRQPRPWKTPWNKPLTGFHRLSDPLDNNPVFNKLCGAAN